jgi:hypothetical protein
MIQQYQLDDFQHANEFLRQLACKMGCLRKGGLPDIDKAAQKVLMDWNNGRLTYFTEPPERANDMICTELVNAMHEAFDIDSFNNYDCEPSDDLHESSVDEISLKQLTLHRHDIQQTNESTDGNIHEDNIDDKQHCTTTSAETNENVRR